MVDDMTLQLVGPDHVDVVAAKAGVAPTIGAATSAIATADDAANAPSMDFLILGPPKVSQRFVML